MSLNYNLPESEYHADTTSLSATGAKTLLRSPAEYRHKLDHPMRTAALELGTLFHALVLGQPHTITVQDWDGRTTAGKARKAEVEQAGLTVISQADWDTAHRMADAVSVHRVADQLFSDGKPEVSAYATDPFTNVPMRGRMDWLREDGWIIDLKSTRDACPDEFAKSCANFGYHVQAAWYMELARANGVDVQGFRFVAVEKTAPHLVSVIELSERAIRHGSELGHQARVIWRECVDSGDWPAWGQAPNDDVVVLDLPRWAYRDEVAQWQ